MENIALHSNIKHLITKGAASFECCLFSGPVKQWKADAVLIGFLFFLKFSWYMYCDSYAKSVPRGRLSVKLFHTTTSAPWKGKKTTLSMKILLWKIENFRVVSLKGRLMRSSALSFFFIIPPFAWKAWLLCSVRLCAYFRATVCLLEMLARRHHCHSVSF